MGCNFFIQAIDFYDFEGRAITNKMYCTNEKDHSGDHLIIASDKDGEYGTNYDSNVCSHNGGVYHDEGPDGLMYMACSDCHETLDDDYE